MKAFGMIEVYGYVAAVEALDSALKAANVNLFQVICAKGGLVTVLFTGDVGAVQASVDAASAAAGQVGSVRSVHVIPRPAEEIGRMLGGPFQGGPSPRSPRQPKPQPQQGGSKSQNQEGRPTENAGNGEPIALENAGNRGHEALENAGNEGPEVFEKAEGQAPATLEGDGGRMEPGQNVPMDWRTYSDEQLHQLTVSELRSIVRSLATRSMTRKEIRFGKKEELIAEIQKFCGQEG